MLNLLECLAQALWRVTDSHRSVFRVWTRCYFLKPLLICTRDICGEAEQTLICHYLSGSQPSRGECGSVCTALQASLLGTGLVFAASWRTLPRRAVNPPRGSDFKKSAHRSVYARVPWWHGNVWSGFMTLCTVLDEVLRNKHNSLTAFCLSGNAPRTDAFHTVFCENK